MADVENGPSPSRGGPALRLRLPSAGDYRVAAPVFSLESRTLQYETQASPALYPGQTIVASMGAGRDNVGFVIVRLFVQYLAGDDSEAWAYGPSVSIAPGAEASLSWSIDAQLDGPIVQVGVALTNTGSSVLEAWLESMDWSGAPDCRFKRHRRANVQWWKHAWVNAVDEWGVQFPESFHLSQNQGTGLVVQGTREWTDYEVSATLTPFQAEEVGLAARVQGLRRYYALLLCREGEVRLVKERDGRTILAVQKMPIAEYHAYECRLVVQEARIEAYMDGKKLFSLADSDRPLTSGALALLVTEGTLTCDEVAVSPVGRRQE